MSFANKQELREFYGEPSQRAKYKQLDKLDVHCRNFIAHSPFLVLSSAGADGSTDASPKGDAPGFVVVLDDQTLLIPDRLGNNRVDSFQNIMENPHVGLLFFVPGMNETLRVNGRASLTTDAALLEPLAVQGKAPKAGLLVKVDEAFLHCAKALIRSNLWAPATQIDRKSFPSMGKMLADQIGTEHSPEADEEDRKRQQKSLY
ncbi:MAG: pyridoxamine 5'-phosphate oxidase family protein [SAR324 cluster bacterium]|nr:pyridoxamine 5'-phosphate oxidase family protein [SAR324 cluster bacterium]